MHRNLKFGKHVIYGATSVQTLGFSTRARNALHCAGIFQYSELRALTPSEIRKLPKAGPTIQEEIVRIRYALRDKEDSSCG